MVRDGGLWLIGQADVPPIDAPVGYGAVLDPVYEIHVAVQPQPGGRVNIAHTAQPLLLAEGFQRWGLSPTAQVWPLEGLSIANQLLAAVQVAEGLLEQMRASRVGIELARSMPKVASNPLRNGGR